MSENKFRLQHQGYNVGELFSSFSFEVPIYQRVFTWGDEQFERLFRDLEEHFWSQDQNERYYLGTITVVRQETGEKLILVDGQQRLTCVLLLGALLGWRLDPYKLNYAARPADRKALENVYSIFDNADDLSLDDLSKIDISKVGNAAMAGFLRFALTSGKGLGMLETLRVKSLTIKERLTLMVSFLPDEPYRKDLFEQNRYFEKMNNGGKQLEPHEILKVQMCKGLDGECLKIWNSVADFGRCCETATGVDNVSVGDNYPLSVVLDDKLPLSESGDDSLLARVYKCCDDKNQLRQYELGIEERDDLRKGLISFSMFLLHVRAQFLRTEKIGDESRLLDLFQELIVLLPERRKVFFDMMKEYRKFLDWEIIHVVSAEGEPRYSFYIRDRDDGIRDAMPDDDEKKALLQFQSMLYVSSGPDQKWLLDAYEKYRGNQGGFGLDSLRQLLRNGGMLDDQVKVSILESTEWPDSCLCYGTENRRWFALLDYLLWERFTSNDEGLQSLLNCGKFNSHKGEISSAIRNFVFKRNRSVEHLHAQTDINATVPDEWENDKDIFGNLALISAGRNSEYGNLSVGGKFDRVDKLLKEGGDKGSRIESIKLLLMLAKCNGVDAEWTVAMAREHANDMLKVLQEFLRKYSDDTSMQQLMVQTSSASVSGQAAEISNQDYRTNPIETFDNKVNVIQSWASRNGLCGLHKSRRYQCVFFEHKIGPKECRIKFQIDLPMNGDASQVRFFNNDYYDKDPISVNQFPKLITLFRRLFPSVVNVSEAELLSIAGDFDSEQVLLEFLDGKVKQFIDAFDKELEMWLPS